MEKKPIFIHLESFTWKSEEEYIIKKSIRNLHSPFMDLADDARRRLKRVGKKCIPYIIEAIEQNDLDSDIVRYELPEVLALFKKDAVSFLIPCLDNPNEDLVYVAKSAIEEVGKNAVPILCKEIETDNLVIKQKIIEILGSIGDKKAIPVLVKCLSDPDESIRDEAEWSLTEIGSSCYDQVLPLLSSDSVQLLCSAIYILPQVDQAKGVSAVIPLFNHPDDDVYNSVIDSLMGLNPAPVDELLSHIHSESTQELIGILNVLANSRNILVIEKISHLKEHPDDDVKEIAEWAIDLLTRSQNEKPIPIYPDNRVED
ncbi:HEAT repeat domain-containing protein [Methanospirillum hungatei]|uniref:HEAT repeat domain-containing protein n=1 Tax=Methanospirillum hungatei TaxID=2203 RepID=UPI0026F142EC|nr:HEAT repeat domain-containing protein [Methanospirillum hungatei]MCA1915733.1 HEAT repeat domain-containing protein [Methanospirillum hungatei]